METDGQSDLDTTLPASARPTGLNRDGNYLYAVISNRPRYGSDVQTSESSGGRDSDRARAAPDRS